MAERFESPLELMAGELAVALAALLGSLVVFAWGRARAGAFFTILFAAVAAVGITDDRPPPHGMPRPRPRQPAGLGHRRGAGRPSPARWSRWPGAGAPGSCR